MGQGRTSLDVHWPEENPCDGPGTLSPRPGTKGDKVPTASEQRCDQGSCSWRALEHLSCTWGSGKVGQRLLRPPESPGTPPGMSSAQEPISGHAFPLAQRLKPLLAQPNSKRDESPCTRFKHARKGVCSRKVTLPSPRGRGSPWPALSSCRSRAEQSWSQPNLQHHHVGPGERETSSRVQ